MNIRREEEEEPGENLDSEFFYSFFPFMPLHASRASHTFQVILSQPNRRSNLSN